MAKGNSRKRIKPKPIGRRGKKKVSPLVAEGVTYVDYKDVELLRRFMSDRAKIRSRRVTGNDSQQQREVARAIKNAREMGLLAYTSRVTTQRRGGRRDERPEGEARPAEGRSDGGGPEVGDRPEDQALDSLEASTDEQPTEQPTEAEAPVEA